MKNIALISLGVVMLAACAPMNTSGSSDNSMSMSGDSTMAMSGDSTMAMSAATTAATTSTAPVGPTTTTNTAGSESKTYTMLPQPGAPAGITGTLAIVASGDNTNSTATLSGLKPSTYYVAHFHNQGAAGTAPCASGGDAILASKIVGMSDNTGSLILKGSVAQNVIKTATYFNVHTASDADGTPADAGVICTAIN